MDYKIPLNIKNGIYKITNNINNKYYIGSACSLYKRFKEHRSALLGGRHHNVQLSRFVKKYGINSLNFEILEQVSIKNLELKEQYYLNNIENKLLFNESKNVLSINRGKKLTKKHKNNISKSLLGYKQTDQHKINKNKSLLGKAGKFVRTKEYNDKISSSNQKHYKLGSKRNKKISNKLKGRIVDWVIHTEETKRKIGEKNKNNNIKPIIQLDKENNPIKEWNSIAEASSYYKYISNINSVRSSISDCLRKKTKSSLNFKWKYKNE